MNTEANAECFLPLEKQIPRDYFRGDSSRTLSLSEKDLQLLGRYLRRMLVFDPKQRAKSEDLLTEPWISEASPEANPEASASVIDATKAVPTADDVDT